jgi:diguanylate cyclase (GGDEF)-like protein
MDLGAGDVAGRAPGGHPGDVDPAERPEATARRALGRALHQREPDILRFCQERYVAAHHGGDINTVSHDPMWRITTVATLAIARWLQTGSGASAEERSTIASLGGATAQQRGMIGRPDGTGMASASTAGRSDRGPVGLSVAMLTRLNFWWHDATCTVLAEEAQRLGVGGAVLHEATGMVLRSAQASLVSMAERFDSELQSLQQRLGELALHDPLTGLANRAVLIEQLERALARLGRHPEGLAVVFLDIDDFKAVNDVFGHACGDGVLVELAARLRANVRPEDVVARLGGDEFVLLFEGRADAGADAQALAERIRLLAAEPMLVEGRELHVTISAGLAVVRLPGRCAEQVLAEADSAMYRAKRAGRNRVAMVDVDDGPSLVRFVTTSGLHQALAQGELRLVYQPVFESRHGTVLGFEALLRWDHPEQGPIPPLEFIAVAEESGLMVAIGEWVLHEACRQAVQWGTQLGVIPRMAVNVSARQLEDPELVAKVAHVLADTGMPPALLMLEMTEAIVLGGGAEHRGALEAVKALGVQLSVDDFGTGYASLAYLRQLPVDQLKVDQTLVHEVARHGDTRIMQAVVRLAHDLGLEVVAEGVETTVELDVAQRLGCDVVQGYLLGRPVPPAAVDLHQRTAAALA